MGTYCFSTGPNGELGGHNDTHCHLDLPMRGCTLYLDDEPIVKDGEIVPAVVAAVGNAQEFKSGEALQPPVGERRM